MQAHDPSTGTAFWVFYSSLCNYADLPEGPGHRISDTHYYKRYSYTDWSVIMCSVLF